MMDKVIEILIKKPFKKFTWRKIMDKEMDKIKDKVNKEVNKIKDKMNNKVDGNNKIKKRDKYIVSKRWEYLESDCHEKEVWCQGIIYHLALTFFYIGLYNLIFFSNVF